MRLIAVALAAGTVSFLACEHAAVPDIAETVPDFAVALADIAPTCGEVITANSRLTADVTGCTGVGLQIGADGITLDCDGHTISSPGGESTGIALHGISGATVKNCHVDGFNMGIWLHFLDDQSTDDNKIIDNTIEHHRGLGMLLYTANNNLVLGNIVQAAIIPEPPDHNVDGIRVMRSTGNLIEQNATNTNMYGIRLWESDNNRLLSNTAVGNDYTGIHLESSDNSEIQGNTVGDGLDGILLDGSNSSVITGNTAYGHGHFGLALAFRASYENRIEGNDFSGGNLASILIENGERNLVTKNLLNENVWAGVVLRDASHNRIEDNTMNANPTGIASRDANPSWNQDHNALIQNTIHASRIGIDLQDCSHESIVGNEIVTSECVSPGIVLSRCTDSEITDNIITKSGNHAHGIRLEDRSNDNTVAGNTIHGSGEWGSYGIFVYGSDRNAIVANSLTETAAGGGCDGPWAFGICNAYRADDNSGVFLVDADENSVTDNAVDVQKSSWGYGNAVRLGGSANFCEGEAGNIVSDNKLMGVTGIVLRGTPTGTEMSNNLITGRQAGTGIFFRPSSDNTVKGNSITGFDQALLFSATSTGNLVEHNNVHANGIAVRNSQPSTIDVRHNYWGTPCPPTALFEQETGGIEWFPQLTHLYPPAIVAEDHDGDGVADVCGRCPQTGSEKVPTEFLLTDHYAEISGDGVFNTNIGSAAAPEIVSAGYTLADTHGCTCEQILAWKPGVNSGELRYGCTEGTMQTWMSQTDWAAPK